MGNRGKDTEADFIIASKMTIRVLNVAPSFWFMACCEVILFLSNLLIVLMSRLAIIACAGLLNKVFWLVSLTHSPAEALCNLAVPIHLNII